MTIDDLIKTLPRENRVKARHMILGVIAGLRDAPVHDPKKIISLKKVREFKMNGIKS